MNIQGLAFELGVAIGNADELVPQPFQVLQTLIESEVFHSIDANLDPQEGAELLIHADHEFFAVDPHHVVTMIELFQYPLRIISENRREK